MSTLHCPLSFQAARRVHTPTVFYMPFAPYHLTENLVRANWGARLHNVAIIGNNFDFVAEWPELPTDEQAFQLQSKHMSKDGLLLVAEECRKKIEVDGWEEIAAKEYGQERLRAAAS